MIHSIAKTRWIASHWRKKPAARLRLFCLPYGGGGSLAYRTWQGQMPDEVDVCPIQLPGREERSYEEPFTQLDPLVEELARELRPHLEVEYAFFGHSAGALISFALARQLRRAYHRDPVHLFLSALPPPQLPRRRPLVTHLPEDEFLEALRSDFELAEALRQNEELLMMISPTLRADLSLVENFVFTHEEPLACPITVFGGLEDPEVTPQELEAWREHTTRSFRKRLFRGTHFYLVEHERMLLAHILQALPLKARF